MIRPWISLLAAGMLWAQAPDPAYAPLDRAYQALRANQYEQAIAGFRQAIAVAPGRAAIHKDLAYALLKVGETAAARDAFAEAMRLDPGDDHVALEYAFLCYETKEPVAARRTFERLKNKGNATAAQAFENVDKPLRDGIARWQQVLRGAPEDFSAHEELARLAEQRDEVALAADHFELAWRLRPGRRDLLLDLGRVLQSQGKPERAAAALLAASRGAEPRVAERAKELLPARYPYVYEFENALKLDPANEALRRELAYLHQEMGNSESAAREFQRLPERAPTQPATLQPILLERDEVGPDPKAMAERSLEKGYLKDAVRFLQSAYESDPADFGVMLKLGWTYNILKQDREAVRWFDLARKSPDLATSAEATRAYANLSTGLRRWRTTVWAFPMISTRWKDTFAYAQAKAELRRARMGVRPYLSIRFIGDLRGPVRTIVGLGPQYLSERSVIIAAGVSSQTWHGAVGWFEAGQALRYQQGGTRPDFRGGVSFARSVSRRRLFGETNDDLLFVSRFGNETLLYSQNRVGRHVGESFDVYWNVNATTDAKREYWANTAETGPGARWRWDGLEFSVNFLRGAYLKNLGNPYRPNYTDVRIGVWYAFSR